MTIRPAPDQRGRAENNTQSILAKMPEAARPWFVSLSVLTAVCAVSSVNTLWERASQALTNPIARPAMTDAYKVPENLPLHVISIRDEILMEEKMEGDKDASHEDGQPELPAQSTNEALTAFDWAEVMQNGITKMLDRTLGCQNSACVEEETQASLIPLSRDSLDEIRRYHGIYRMSEWPQRPIGHAVSDLEIIAAFMIVLETESNNRQFDKDGYPILSKKGAIGVAQIMPKTAPEAAKIAKEKFSMKKLLTDQSYGKRIGFAYFNKLVRDFGGDLSKGFAAYNAGPGATRSAVLSAKKSKKANQWLKHLPQETQAYVAKNMAAIKELHKNGSFLANADIKELAMLHKIVVSHTL